MKHFYVLPLLLISGVLYGQDPVWVSTSFEDVSIEAGINDGIYIDTGDPSVSHELINNNGQTPVNFFGDFPAFGFTASYIPYDTPGTGLSDGDFVGITNSTSTVGAFTDGVQGYRFQDTDGNMILTFDPLEMDSVIGITLSLDYFIQETDWEYSDDSNSPGNDYIRIYAINLDTGTEIDLLNTSGADIDDLAIEGSWNSLTADIPDQALLQLVVVFRSNSSNESLFLDNVVISFNGVLNVNELVLPEFSMYPNPAQGSVINIVSTTNQTKNVVVYDILGQQVKTAVVTNSRMNIGNLSPGVYLVKISENGTTVTKKLVVQ